jgi:hypothetical protein
MDGLSNSDVALLANRDNDMFGGAGGSWMWFLALLVLMGGGNFLGNNGRGDYVTQAQFADGLSNQSIQAQLQQIALSSANNNYETAQLLNQQSNMFLQQNNTNLINSIQGFNTVNQAIADLGYHMDKCCCEIKTQMLQDKLEATQSDLFAARTDISNANQSQYLLSQLGRFVAWTPSGTQASTVTGA